MNEQLIKKVADEMAQYSRRGSLKYIPKDFYKLGKAEQRECITLFKKITNTNKPFDETK